MNVLKTPQYARRDPYPYPSHSTGNGIEKSFALYAESRAINTHWTYLPIYWTNNYCHQRGASGEAGFRVVDEVQRFLDDSLQDDEYYFTIVQNDDGIYERLPDNVFVFGAGGVGDEPIPLLCDQHPRCPVERDLLASFAGTIECGGPVELHRKPIESSWNKDGHGAVARRAMKAACEGQPGIVIEPSSSSERFRSLMERSLFALCPRGYGLTSYRMYEAMGLGCVPVYIFNPSRIWLPYIDVINWWDICVMFHAANVAELPGRLREIRGSWREKAIATIEDIYDDYFTLEGMCKQIARMVEEKSR